MLLQSPLGAEALGYIDILMVSRGCGKFHWIPPAPFPTGISLEGKFQPWLAGPASHAMPAWTRFDRSALATANRSSAPST